MSLEKASEPVAPNQIEDFPTLYAQNCSGCHGAQGRGGASIALSDPVYLAIIDESAMRKVIANGVRGTSMPAFAQSAGGMLTDTQVDVITSGIFSHWSRKEFSTEPIRLPMRQIPRATPHVVNLFMEHIAPPATVLKAGADLRVVPLRIVPFSLSSAIRDCAPSSFRVGLNWVRQTGVGIFRDIR